MRSPVSTFKRIIANGLLALTFLCVPQAATLHWLSLAIEATQTKASQATTSDGPCDQCLAFSALGSTASGHEAEHSFDVAHECTSPSAVAAASPAVGWLAFRSRAPPSLT